MMLLYRMKVQNIFRLDIYIGRRKIQKRFLILRFIKEDVAFMLYEKGATPEENTYFPICALDDVDETDEVEMVGVMRSFNLLGFGLFPKLIGELRPYIPQSEIEG